MLEPCFVLPTCQAIQARASAQSPMKASLTSRSIGKWPPRSLMPMPPFSSVRSIRAMRSALSGLLVLIVMPARAASITAMLTPAPLSGIESRMSSRGPAMSSVVHTPARAIMRWACGCPEVIRM